MKELRKETIVAENIERHIEQLAQQAEVLRNRLESSPHSYWVDGLDCIELEQIEKNIAALKRAILISR